ncbi:hypothetical protein CEXT_270851 [Caerostris extrusa]|uniref:Uncharacterized protein n=1 Tax=Caerostris extrusa TaxID=172846 RepID=A0AAV4T5J3_CAEEX|nr:hypothetical protein CEXT_270851 [Caerostris extrusa]
MEPLASNNLRFHFSFADYPGRFLNPQGKSAQQKNVLYRLKQLTFRRGITGLDTPGVLKGSTKESVESLGNFCVL